jgi:NAD(P)-dependent dehydrogenase (short-subunit alcohol dehydrogenase family)
MPSPDTASPFEMGGKALLVTGAGRGLGRAITLEALRAGAAVAAVDIDPALLEELVSSAAADASQLITLIGDVCKRDTLLGAAAALAARCGGVDAVVSNAALLSGAYRPSWPIDARGWVSASCT